MNHTQSRPEPDAVGRALEVLSDRWTFLVLREAFFGVRRYGFFQRNLGIGRNVLADRLSALVEHGLLTRVRYRTEPDWYEYRLTRAGIELFPVILALKAWSEQHLLDAEDPKLDIHHCSCGAEITPVVTCDCCGKPISAHDVEYGPEADAIEEPYACGPTPLTQERPSGRLLRTVDSQAQ